VRALGKKLSVSCQKRTNFTQRRDLAIRNILGQKRDLRF
jgi:hypothetical protein